MRYTLKDCFAVKDVETTYGTNKSYFTLTSSEDSKVIRDNKDQLVGVSSCTPFACGNLDPSKTLEGIPVGGSSSGSVLDLLQGRCDYSIGSDVGGSCRTPAVRAGIFGLKGTKESIPVQGMYSCCSSLESVGIMAKELITLKKAFLNSGVDHHNSWKKEKVIQGPLVEKEDVQGAWFAKYLPQFFSNSMVFNGLHHRFPPRGYKSTFSKRSTAGRDSLPPIVKCRILAGARLALKDPKDLRKQSIEKFLSILNHKYPEDTLIVTPVDPLGVRRKSDFDDSYLLLANLLDRPSLVLPWGGTGLQLIGPKGSEVKLISYAEKLISHKY